MLKLAGSILPHVSLSSNAWSIAPAAWLAKAPNYNTPWMNVEGVSPDNVKWLIEAPNRQPEDPVILYLHGGGYALGAFPIMAHMLLTIWRKVGCERLSIVWLDYTLTDVAGFPQQLCETVAVHNVLQRSCSNIMMLGDSAGGHLILNVFRHAFVEPYDGVALVEGRENVKAVILISPWVNIGASSNEWSSAFCRDLKKLQSPELNPSRDPINWSGILPANLFIGYGENESSRKSIEDWVKLASAEGSVFIERRGGHDSLATRSSMSIMMKPVVEFIRNAIKVA